MKEGVLFRIKKSDKQTLGRLIIFNGIEEVFNCCTLELAWKFNKNNTSCIPTNEYLVKPYNSPTKGKVYLFENVPSRDMIEIHVGNKYTDIKGCIIIGSEFVDINGDGELDVINSKITMEKFLDVMENEILKLKIIDL